MRMSVDPPELLAAAEAVREAGDLVASVTAGPLDAAVGALVLAMPGSWSVGELRHVAEALGEAAIGLRSALTATADELRVASARYADTEDRTVAAVRRTAGAVAAPGAAGADASGPHPGRSR